MNISIETTVNAPIDIVWTCWTSPEHIKNWNYASDEWHCPSALVELKAGGRFSYRMEAKDGSMGFDFEGLFTSVNEYSKIEFKIDDDRCVQIHFTEMDDGIRIQESFEAEDVHTGEQQRQGWQNILDNFREYVEKNAI